MSFELIDKSFLKKPGNYFFQSFLAIVALVIILYFVGIMTQAAIVAALGSSAFIVFAMPGSVSAQPRRLIGGNVIGLLIGILCYYVFFISPVSQLLSKVDFTLWAALAVGLSIFLMTITNTEHPPAAGVALGIVAQEWSYKTVIFVLAYAISLAVVKRLLKGNLKDLC
ncbi:MAG: HPP family protein [Chloroflexota bacterium]